MALMKIKLKASGGGGEEEEVAREAAAKVLPSFSFDAAFPVILTNIRCMMMRFMAVILSSR